MANEGKDDSKKDKGAEALDELVALLAGYVKIDRVRSMVGQLAKQQNEPGLSAMILHYLMKQQGRDELIIPKSALKEYSSDGAEGSIKGGVAICMNNTSIKVRLLTKDEVDSAVVGKPLPEDVVEDFSSVQDSTDELIEKIRKQGFLPKPGIA